jgi:hypothetical protein
VYSSTAMSSAQRVLDGRSTVKHPHVRAFCKTRIQRKRNAGCLECCSADVDVLCRGASPHIRSTHEMRQAISPSTTWRPHAAQRPIAHVGLPSAVSSRLVSSGPVPSLILLATHCTLRSSHRTRRWCRQAQTLREPRRQFGLALWTERNFEKATKSALRSKLQRPSYIFAITPPPPLLPALHSSARCLHLPEQHLSHTHNAVLKIITDCEY